MEHQGRIGLIVYLYYNRDARRLSKLGDLHYHSRRGKYVVLYINEETQKDCISFLSEQRYVKKVAPSQLDTIDTEFVGSLNRYDTGVPNDH